MARLRSARLWSVRLGSALCGLVGGILAISAPLPAQAQNAAETRAPVEAPPDALSPEVTALIEQLGDDSFGTREAASAKLAALGMSARPALERALKSGDPEVRLRARRLLGQIQAAHLDARLKAFMADIEGRREHDLPGWARYRKLVGENQAARKLFADMHRSEPGLMETSAGGGDAAAECLQVRAYHLLRAMQMGYTTGRTGGPPLSAVAALLFVAGDERAQVADATQMQVYNFIQQQSFQAALRSEGDGPQVNRLLGSWVARQTGPTTSQVAIQLSVQWDLREGAPAARRVLAEKSSQVYVRAIAAVALAKIGGKEDLKLLVETLDDKTPFNRRVVLAADGKRTEHNSELRDVALAALVYLTGQKFEDYGLNNIRINSQTFFNYGQVHFPTPEARDAALKKWREWSAKNPLEVSKPAAKTEKTSLPATATTRLGGIALAAPLVMVPGAVAQADAKPNEELPFYVADREAGQRLARARQLIEEGQFAPALRVLDAILADGEDRSFQPEIGRPLYLSLRIEAQRLLGLLPEEGRRAYELLVGNEARRELEEAVAAGEPGRLEQIARRYLPSAAGQEAALLLGAHLLDSGRPLAAAIVLSALREHDHERRFEPVLSLRIAHSWLLAGMPQEARGALQQMKPPREGFDTLGGLEYAGRRLPPLDHAHGKSIDNLLAALSELTPAAPSASPEAGDWPLFRGDVRRNASTGGNASTAGDVPWLRSQWRVQSAKTSAVRNAITTLDTAYRKERLSVLPTGHPLVVGDTLLARTTGELLALDIQSGAVRWSVPLTDAADDLMTAPGGQPADSSAILRGIDERVWNDLTYGTLASDGRCVYLVEDVGLVHGLAAERMVVRPDGSRRLDAGWPGENNRLTAYDLRTGKFRWEIGGPRGDFQLDLAGAYFLGPPLPLAGKLYVVAEADERIALLALDPASGNLLERFPLATLDQAETNPRAVAAYVQALPGRPSRRLSGASPAYSAGVMVCPTSWNSFTAVDVRSGAILWSYRPMRLDETSRGNVNVLFVGLAQPPADLDDALRRDDRWADCSATIAGDRVLVTPRTGDRLLCLDLRTGRLLWEAPRGDAQYVAGVHVGELHVGESLRDSQTRLGETRPRAVDGTRSVPTTVALLVGRSSVRGLRMSDGQPAWQPVPLPPGARPSGRGYFSDGRYYLPLTSAEVAVIDPAAGRLSHRASSVDGRVPGNLVCSKEYVVSQNANGVECFPRLDIALKAAALHVAKQPNDPATLAEHGRMLLARGDYAQAIGQLRRALELGRDDAVRATLCDAVLQALEADFAAHRQTAAELADVFKQAGQHSAYLRALATGLQRAGERLAALDTLLELIADQATVAHAARVRDELQPVTATLYSRTDAWLRGQLADLRGACTPEELAEVDRRIANRLDKAIQGKDARTLWQWLRVLGDHAAAAAARQALLTQYLDPSTGKLLPKVAVSLRETEGISRSEMPTLVRPLDVERLLLETQADPDAARSRAAAAALAKMLVAQSRPEEAAIFYRRLNGEWADAACLAGKTGRQLFAELPSDSPVRRVLNAPGAWPQGVVERQTQSGARARAQSAWPLNVETTNNGLFDELRLEITSANPSQKLVARDAAGAERWSVELKTPEVASLGLSPQVVRAKLDGHLLFAWQGNRVVAIDTLAGQGQRPEILWTKDLTTTFPGLEGGKSQQQRVLIFAGGVPVFTADAYGRPMAEIGPVTGRMICYQSLRTLTAVDPSSGAALWSRHDVPQGCELLGDDEVILAVPRDSTTATVYRAADGRELGRCEVPDKRDRVAVLGRHVATWTGDDERQTLRLLDPWRGRDVWTREFPAGSKLSRIGPQAASARGLGSQETGVPEVGVLEPQGNFAVLSLADGRPRVSARLKPPANLLDIHVLRSDDRYLLLAKQTPPAPAAAADKPAERIMYPLTLGGQAELVSGTLYGLDRATGAVRWEHSIEQRGIDLSQAAHWPILVLAERVYYQGEKVPRRYEMKVTCLDRRDGRTVFEETSPLAGSQLQVVPDASSHSIEVRTGNSFTRLVFTGKPWPSK